MILYEKKLHKVVTGLKEKNVPGLSLFLTGGYPTLEKFLRLLKFIDKEELADFVEIGIPFSDPVADGAVIQASSRQAIKNGATFRKIIDGIKGIGGGLKMPLVLMTYLNPVYAGGIKRNLNMARQAGFEACILPDLPVDESGEFLAVAGRLNLGVIFLASPSTSPVRISRISSKSHPFLYYVSRFGITGERKQLADNILDKIKSIKKHSKIPVYCGFGISNPQQAAVVGKVADGVIIGSAFIKLISKNESVYFKEIRKFAINIKKELKMCRLKSH